MKLLDVFTGLSVDSRVLNMFVDCDVDNISMPKSGGDIRVRLFSGEFIRPAMVRYLERSLFQQFFYDSGRDVRVHVSYPFLFGKKISEIWNDLSEFVLEDIRLRDHLDGTFLDDADFREDDNSLTVILQDYSVTRSRKQAIIDELHKSILEMTDNTCNIFLEYSKPQLRDEEPDDEYPLSMEEFIARNEAAKARKEAKKHAGEKPKDLQKPKSREEVAKGPDDKDKKKKYAVPADPDIVYGKAFAADRVMQIMDIQDEIGDVIIAGQIISYEDRVLKSGDRYLVSFSVTDFTDTINVKLFVKEDILTPLRPEIALGKFIMLKGMAQYDKFDHEITVGSVTGIKKFKDTRAKRSDLAAVKRIELHAHTQMSNLDAVTNVKELVKRAFDWGHPAIAITDHGVVQSFVDASHAIDPKKFADDPEKTERFKNFKIIYGCEGYLVDDEGVIDENGNPVTYDLEKDKETISKLPSYHIILLCKNDIGRVNLYRLVSMSHLDYMYKKRPRIPKSLLRKYRDGIIVGSACEAGELFRAILNKKPEAELRRIRDFYDYYEIQPCGNNAFLIRDDKYPEITTEQDLQDLNKKIVQLADDDGKLCVATCDVHFLNPEDEIYREIIHMNKFNKKSVKKEDLEETRDEEQTLNASKLQKELEEKQQATTDEIAKAKLELLTAKSDLEAAKTNISTNIWK